MSNLTTPRPMRPSKIEFYLQRVSQGDSAFLESLCRQLAERLLQVPVFRTAKAEFGGTHAGQREETFKIFRIEEPNRVIVPVFSCTDRFKSWAAAQGVQLDALSLLGADVCMSIGERVWMVVDPGSESAVELQPHLVKTISQIEPIEGGAEDAAISSGIQRQMVVKNQEREETEIVTTDIPVEQPRSMAAVAPQITRIDSSSTVTPNGNEGLVSSDLLQMYDRGVESETQRRLRERREQGQSLIGNEKGPIQKAIQALRASLAKDNE